MIVWLISVRASLQILFPVSPVPHIVDILRRIARNSAHAWSVLKTFRSELEWIFQSILQAILPCWCFVDVFVVILQISTSRDWPMSLSDRNIPLPPSSPSPQYPALQLSGARLRLAQPSPAQHSQQHQQWFSWEPLFSLVLCFTWAPVGSHHYLAHFPLLPNWLTNQLFIPWFCFRRELSPGTKSSPVSWATYLLLCSDGLCHSQEKSGFRPPPLSLPSQQEEEMCADDDQPPLHPREGPTSPLGVPRDPAHPGTDCQQLEGRDQATEEETTDCGPRLSWQSTIP